MYKIALGTTSQDKKNIVVKAMKIIYPEREFSIMECDIKSGVTDQPLDEDITLTGSINRAKNALELIKEADLGIGLEAGLVEIFQQGLFLVCICTIIDKKGKLFSGISGKVRLPAKVSDLVKNGESFGATIRTFKDNSKQADLVMLSERLINREIEFTDAIIRAFDSLKIKDVYSK